MDTFNNLGMPIILSDEPKATVENPNPIIFLVLGTATFLVDFQYSTEITGAGNLLNNTKSVLEPSELKRVVTSYTVYLAGSGRAVVNRVYSTKGVAPDKAYKAAYKDLKDIYELAIGNLTNNRSSWDIVEWKCDNNEYK